MFAAALLKPHSTLIETERVLTLADLPQSELPSTHIHDRRPNYELIVIAISEDCSSMIN